MPQMLASLPSPKVDIISSDNVDETASMRKWNNKAQKHLERLNSDINQTAGLEGKLTLCIGARVMLRKNIDVSIGLVNGGIGTVLSMKPSIQIKFDNIPKECDIEMVSNKFVSLKHYSVYRKQFPLILAFAITIHKSQGLSLDTAIIDLSNNVFSPGMAYVALSGVRTLSGIHLTAFDPKSIIVEPRCINEINRLRKIYCPNLPQYVVLENTNKPIKRKYSCVTQPADIPPSKVPKISTVQDKCAAKRSLDKPDSDSYSKRMCLDERGTPPQNDDGGSVITGASGPNIYYVYNPGNATLQRYWCGLLNLQYVRAMRPRLGCPTTALTPPTRIA